MTDSESQQDVYDESSSSGSEFFDCSVGAKHVTEAEPKQKQIKLDIEIGGDQKQEPMKAENVSFGLCSPKVEKTLSQLIGSNKVKPYILNLPKDEQKNAIGEALELINDLKDQMMKMMENVMPDSEGGKAVELKLPGEEKV